jgi:hypothetical protein
MSYQLSDHEFTDVSALEATERLEHFIERISACEEVWGLQAADGWVLSAVPSGEEVAPFWPHPLYAKACALDVWQDAEPQAVSLDQFLERWIPGLIQDKRLISVFSTPDSSGVLLTPDQVKAMIDAECEHNYGEGT